MGRPDLDARKQFEPTDIIKIRSLWDSGKYTARGIAKMYGCAAETIARIGRRETWAWLEEQAVSEMRADEAQAALEDLLKQLEGK